MSNNTPTAGSDFSQVFHRKTPEGRGACLMLANTAATNIASALSTGVFHTAFLALNGIDIVRIGLLGSIPSLCWIFSIFTPKIMGHFKSRRAVLFWAHIVNILCTVLGTTIMPMFVSDYLARTVWFGVFLLIGNLASALFSSGATQWQLHFIPKEDQLCSVYYSFQNIFSVVISTATNISASLIADRLAGQPQELPVINNLRFLALGFYALSGVLVYLLPKEYPYETNRQSIRLLDTIRLPLRERKFLLTASVIFCWTFMTSCNGNTWTYYLKETVGASYLAMQANGISMVAGNLFLLPWFRRLLERYSLPAMLRFGILGLSAMQLLTSFVGPGGVAYYVCIMIPNGILWSLVNLCTANAFVYNLPEQNRDVHTVFWNLMLQIATFLGANFGAWFLNLLGNSVVMHVLGVAFYGSQALMLFKFFVNFGLSWYVFWLTPRIRH